MRQNIAEHSEYSQKLDSFSRHLILNQNKGRHPTYFTTSIAAQFRTRTQYYCTIPVVGDLTMFFSTTQYVYVPTNMVCFIS